MTVVYMIYIYLSVYVSMCFHVLAEAIRCLGMSLLMDAAHATGCWTKGAGEHGGLCRRSLKGFTGT